SVAPRVPPAPRAGRGGRLMSNVRVPPPAPLPRPGPPRAATRPTPTHPPRLADLGPVPGANDHVVTPRSSIDMTAWSRPSRGSGTSSLIDGPPPPPPRRAPPVRGPLSVPSAP